MFRGHMVLSKRVRGVLSVVVVLILVIGTVFFLLPGKNGPAESGASQSWQPGDPINWVEFDIPCHVMEQALGLDVDSHAQPGDVTLDWVEMLAYLSAKYWGDFGRFREKDLKELTQALQSGDTMENLTDGLKMYHYYLECYSAVLSGFVGHYRVGVPSEEGTVTWEEKYGLKVFLPLADGFPYTHYDDFGVSRSYGYKRKHLGHDMMSQVGTPVIAVETGVVEEMGWNRYGGWRVGIRSVDGRRYYYYAHLRKNRPFSEGLEKGLLVYAGDVIGYVGRTGYSDKENVNGVKQSHLHWGMQLVFDETQREGSNEIWIDIYEITKLLRRNRSKTIRNAETKEHTRAVPFEEPPSEVRTTGGHDPERVKLPVIMYHSLLKSRAGQNKFIISPEQLEADLRFLRDNGWHTVVMDDLIQFVETGKPLPEKPILLTFDDGYYNNIHYAEPLLSQYGMNGVLAVVGAFTDKSTAEGEQNPAYSYANWETLREVSARGVFDIQSHTYDMHGARQGCVRRPGESLGVFRQAFFEDNERLSAKLAEYIGKMPTTLVYPFGAMSVESEQLAREAGFKSSMSCYSGINSIAPGDTECLYQLKRILRSQNMTVEMILEKYD